MLVFRQNSTLYRPGRVFFALPVTSLFYDLTPRIPCSLQMAARQGNTIHSKSVPRWYVVVLSRYNFHDKKQRVLNNLVICFCRPVMDQWTSQENNVLLTAQSERKLYGDTNTKKTCNINCKRLKTFSCHNQIP